MVNITEKCSQCVTIYFIFVFVSLLPHVIKRVLAGVLAFLVVEKFVRICKGPGHGHSHGPPKTKKETKGSDKKKDKSKENEETKKQEGDHQGELDEEKKETAEKKPSRTSLKASPKSTKDKETEDTSKCPDSPSGKRVRFTGVDKIVPLPSEPGMKQQTKLSP